MQTEKNTRERWHTLLESFPCPYFEDGRMATTEYVLPGEEWTHRFHELLTWGYRRLGSITYRNACKMCSACEPIRIETSRFKTSKSQRRTLKKNHDIRLEIRPPSHITMEKLELFVRYQNSKHAAHEKESLDHETLLSISHCGYANTIEMDYYLDDRLIGVGIIDEAKDSLSSNYFYYDTDFLDRRLGIFSILKEISLAKDMGKRYLYLGFYIEQNQKMSYKKYFRPNQILEKGEWKEFLL
jgi:arginine-tRNA-protein transferase